MSPKLLLAALAFAAPAFAGDSASLSARDLHAYCRALDAEPDSAAASRCASYVRGFIDGIVAAAKPDPPPKEESWTERAARTRLGERYDSALLLRTDCLEDPQARNALIERVLGTLRAASAPEGGDARSLVLGIVREYSPCRA